MHDHDHDIMTLTATSYDKVVDNDPHVWVVKFFSHMCGSCQAFAPTFEEAQKQVNGLHWAQVSIDDKANIALAKKMGVLEEGIPNVKLVNAAELPLPIVSGDTPSAEAVVAKLRETLSSAGAATDAGGFYLAHGRSEL